MSDIPAPELAIATRNLSKQFDRLLAVDNVDLEVADGEVYGLIGPNGAGKTTLMRMLAAIETPPPATFTCKENDSTPIAPTLASNAT